MRQFHHQFKSLKDTIFKSGYYYRKQQAEQRYQRRKQFYQNLNGNYSDQQLDHMRKFMSQSEIDFMIKCAKS